METLNKEKETAIEISGVKKKYKLGQIGGGSLREDIQSWWARKRGKEDPNSIIGQDQRLVGKSFMALNGIDLTIHKGEALGIIGSNGAGKSTLLKLLCQVTAPTEGDIDIYGRITSMLEVGTGFNGEMTGRENIYMNGTILGMTKAEIDSKMDDIIEFSEVGDFIDTPVKRYSSGMFIKLGFAVASHLESEIMIMDEVLAVGDMAFQKKCLSKMREAATKEGRTILYVSHNMNTIKRLCDRCVVLDKGKLIFDGDVEKAIAIYLSAAAISRDVHIDLSDKRMDHLPDKIKAKMISLDLMGKEVASYKMNEKIILDLKVRSNKDIKQLCMRLEIRAADGSSIGVSMLQNFGSMMSNEEITYRITTILEGLIPGDYTALLVLYEVNEWGNYEDLDAVYPAFSFEINDTSGQLAINWDNYNWGKIKFRDLMVEKVAER